jgi:hypothetical protein
VFSPIFMLLFAICVILHLILCHHVTMTEIVFYLEQLHTLDATTLQNLFQMELSCTKDSCLFFIECIREEESTSRPACVGYRVFLSTCVGVSSFIAAHISHTTVTLQPFTGPDSFHSQN